MREPAGPAVGAARSWVRLYTAGLPADIRDGRRAEVEADIWDHHREALAEARPFAVELGWRVAAGIPADLAWRHSQQPASTLARAAVSVVAARVQTGASWTMRIGLPSVGFLLAAGYLLLGALLLLTFQADGDLSGDARVTGGVVLVLAGLAIAAGLRFAAGHRRIALALIGLGALPLGLAFAQTIVVPIASVAAMLAAWWRSRRAAA
jgi:hypothetical protein